MLTTFLLPHQTLSLFHANGCGLPLKKCSDELILFHPNCAGQMYLQDISKQHYMQNTTYYY